MEWLDKHKEGMKLPKNSEEFDVRKALRPPKSLLRVLKPRKPNYYRRSILKLRKDIL